MVFSTLVVSTVVETILSFLFHSILIHFTLIFVFGKTLVKLAKNHRIE